MVDVGPEQLHSVQVCEGRVWHQCIVCMVMVGIVWRGCWLVVVAGLYGKLGACGERLGGLGCGYVCAVEWRVRRLEWWGEYVYSVKNVVPCGRGCEVGELGHVAGV